MLLVYEEKQVIWITAWQLEDLCPFWWDPSSGWRPSRILCMAVAVPGCVKATGIWGRGDVCEFLLWALLKLLSPSHGQASFLFFLSLPYFLFLAPLAAAYDNGQESRKKHYISMRSEKYHWHEENSTSRRGGLFLTLCFTERSFSLDLSLLPLAPDRLPSIVLEVKENSVGEGQLHFQV